MFSDQNESSRYNPSGKDRIEFQNETIIHLLEELVAGVKALRPHTKPVRTTSENRYAQRFPGTKKKRKAS